MLEPVTIVLPRPWLRYGLSVLVSVLALGANLLLDSRLSQTPAPIFFAAVVLAARYGGLGPGLVSTVLCALGLAVFLEDPTGLQGGGSSLLHLAVFVLVAMLVSALTDRMRRAEAQARADAIRLSILADASRALTSVIPDHVKTLQTVARQIAESLGDACVISLLSEDGQRLSHAAWHHRNGAARALQAELYASHQHLADEGIAGRALREKRPIVMATDNPDAVREATSPAYATLLERFPVYSIVSVPLTARARSIGALSVWRCEPGRPFTDADQKLLQELANRSAIAIDGARLSIYYQALFEGMPEPTVVVGADHHLLDANPAAVRLLRRSVSDLRRCSIETLISGDSDSLASINAELDRGGRWNGELDLQRVDGSSVPVEVSAVAVPLLTGPVSIWVWHDLTQQHAMQQMRDRFVAATSHELRTPLTAAQAALGLIQQPESGRLHAAHRELVDNAMRNVLRLRILVDDLLTEGQLQAQVLGLQPQPLDLREVIASAVEAVHSLLQRKGQVVELDVPEPLPVNGDARRLEQLFVNLIANAHLHTPRRTRIEIAGRASGDTVTVSVCDDGPGIPVEHIDTIFDRFSRADSTAKGTGLGLAIAHDLTKAHGGHIWADQLPGHGAAFRIVLPALTNGE